jgi:hypothetical protein
MKYRAFMKPHEIELLEAVNHHLRSAQETASYTRRLISQRAMKRARQSA